MEAFEFIKADRSKAFARETWRTVSEFPNYEVSSFGEIRSKVTGKKLAPTVSRDGYAKLNFYRDGQRFTRTIHRLVATAFLYREANKDFVNHIDCNKLNNRPGNLEWTDRKGNAHHAKINGRYLPTTGENHWTRREPQRRHFGEKNGRAILTAEQARFIKNSQIARIELAKQFGICKGTVHAIKQGRIWKGLI